MANRQPTIQELIEAQIADIGKFKLIISRYSVQNPAKYLVKKEELEKKLTLKEQRLKDLQEILEKQGETILAEERAREQQAKEAENKRLADIEKARQEGYEQGLKEQGTKTDSLANSTK